MFATILLMLLVGAILCAILIASNEIIARRSLSRHWSPSRLFWEAGHPKWRDGAQAASSTRLGADVVPMPGRIFIGTSRSLA